jgi:hypothetical protein
MRLIAILLLCAACSSVQAHKASDAFLEIRPEREAISIRWDIALRDLDQVLDLDRNGNQTLEWGEIERQRAVIEAYAGKAIDFATATGPCVAGPMSLRLARRGGETYAALNWRAACSDPGAALKIRYELLKDVDPTHRALVSVPGSGVDLRNLRPSESMQNLDLRVDKAGSVSYDLAGFFVEGVLHILDGWDHLAFLVALLIPLLARAAAGNRRLGAIVPELLTVVSVFTVAHSITLGLTAAGLIGLPSRLVESLIALSVVVAGAQGLLAGAFRHRGAAPGRAPYPPVVPTLGERRLAMVPLWLVFAFGLVHGMGFGGALGEAGFGGRSVMAALLGFNLGVEAGQLAVLAVVFPAAWSLRKTAGFNRVLLPVVALVIIAAGTTWLGARVFDFDLVSLVAAT